MQPSVEKRGVSVRRSSARSRRILISRWRASITTRTRILHRHETGQSQSNAAVQNCSELAWTHVESDVTHSSAHR